MKPYMNKDILKKSYKERGSLQSTADFFGVSKKTILNYMKKFDIERNSKTISFDMKKAYEMLKEGKSQNEVAAFFNISIVTLHRRLTSKGYKTNFFHKGYIETWNGYRMIHKPQHPFADTKGYIREHRYVMEKSLGRYLSDDEHVHHIDGDKANNDISNLELMKGVDHITLHSRRPRKNIDEKKASEMLETMTMKEVSNFFNVSESGLRKRLHKTGYYKPLPRGGARHSKKI